MSGEGTASQLSLLAKEELSDIEKSLERHHRHAPLLRIRIRGCEASRLGLLAAARSCVLPHRDVAALKLGAVHRCAQGGEGGEEEEGGAGSVSDTSAEADSADYVSSARAPPDQDTSNESRGGRSAPAMALDASSADANLTMPQPFERPSGPNLTSA